MTTIAASAAFVAGVLVALSSCGCGVKPRRLPVLQTDAIVGEVRTGKSIYSLDCSATNGIIVAAGAGGTVSTCSIEGQLLESRVIHEEPIYSIRQIGRPYIATASWDKTVKVTDVDLWTCRHITVPFARHGVTAMDWSPRHHLLFAGAADASGDLCTLWDRSLEIKQRTKAHKRGIQHIVYSHDLDLVVTCSVDETYSVWEITNSELRPSYCGRMNGAVESAAFDTLPRKRYAVADSAGFIRVNSATDNKSMAQFRAADGVNCLCFIPGTSYLLAAIGEGHESNSVIESYNIDTQKAGKPFVFRDRGAIRAIAITRDNEHICFAGESGIIYIVSLDIFSKYIDRSLD